MILVILDLGISVGYGLAIQKYKNDIIFSQFANAGLLILNDRLSIEYARKIDEAEIFQFEK